MLKKDMPLLPHQVSKPKCLLFDVIAKNACYFKFHNTMFPPSVIALMTLCHPLHQPHTPNVRYETPVATSIYTITPNALNSIVTYRLTIAFACFVYKHPLILEFIICLFSCMNTCRFCALKEIPAAARSSYITLNIDTCMQTA